MRRTGRTEYGYWITPPPPRVVAMTLALEDGRFWRHPGVDPLAVARAAWFRLRGGRSGASTIAMQVARMQHPRPRTLWAKTIEAGTALALTARYGREAVLAQYLRLAPYGQGSHGIGHAAWWYFDKPAADLGWAEAALLAAVPQAPALAQPRHAAGLARAQARAARVLPAAYAGELMLPASTTDAGPAGGGDARAASPRAPRRRSRARSCGTDFARNPRSRKAGRDRPVSCSGTFDRGVGPARSMRRSWWYGGTPGPWSRRSDRPGGAAGRVGRSISRPPYARPAAR